MKKHGEMPDKEIEAIKEETPRPHSEEIVNAKADKCVLAGAAAYLAKKTLSDEDALRLRLIFKYGKKKKIKVTVGSATRIDVPAFPFSLSLLRGNMGVVFILGSVKPRLTGFSCLLSAPIHGEVVSRLLKPSSVGGTGRNNVTGRRPGQTDKPRLCHGGKRRPAEAPSARQVCGPLT